MVYDRRFNNPLILFTAFTGNMTTSIPVLDWRRVSYAELGMEDLEIGIGVFDNGSGSYLLWGNGDSYLSSGDAKLRYFDMATKSWVADSGYPFHVDFAGNGYFLSIVNERIYASTDGKSWTTGGELLNLGAQGCLAVAANGTAATALCWNANIPVYSGSIGGGTWAPSASQTNIAFSSSFRSEEALPSPFTGVTYHKGICLAWAYGGESYVGICAGGGSTWTETLPGPYHIDGLRSIGGKLFMRLALTADGKTSYQLCVLSDDASSYQAAISGKQVPFLNAITWCDRLGRFMAVADDGNSHAATLFSFDGLHWEAAPTVNDFTASGSSLIYIPEVGFYATYAGGLYFAEYTA